MNDPLRSAERTRRRAHSETVEPRFGFRAGTRLDDSEETLRQTRLAVARAKEGDRDAVRFLYSLYSDNVYGYVRSIVRDEHDAEDVTQHVFAKLITVLVKYDDRGVPFFAWLLRLARNVAIDHLRANRSGPSDYVVDHEDPAVSSLDRPLAVRDALAALPRDQREVMILRHVLGLSPAEIATRIGRTEASVHGLQHRGRRALQRELIHMDSAPSTARRAALQKTAA
jgi:RNA polymerase sigma-70 factor (ECF subfamily)